MSTRAIYESNRVEYLLPTSVGAQVGDVLTLAAGGQLAFEAGGEGGGLTQQQVYGAGAIYELPVLASAQNGQIMTVQDNGGTNELVFANAPAGTLTAQEVYGQGAVYQLPELAAAAADTILTVQDNGGTNELVFSAQAQGLTQQDVYGNGPIYQLPAIGANGTVATVSNGELAYEPLPQALTAAEVWEVGNAQYTLPDISGVANGLSLAANGNGQIIFTEIAGAGLTQNQVYGAGAPFALPVIADADAGDVLTVSGGAAVWQPPADVLTAADVWQNPANQSKIPDATAAAAGTVLTLTDVNTGATGWVAPPGVPASAIWDQPAAAYKLPAIGTEGQILTVSATPNVLEFADPPSISTSTQIVQYQITFPTFPNVGQLEIEFARTGDMVVCNCISAAISTQDVTGANLYLMAIEPQNQGQRDLAIPFMPNTNPNLVFLTTVRFTQTSGAGSPSSVIAWIALNPQTANFTMEVYQGTMVTDSVYTMGTDVNQFIQLGAWAITGA